MDAIRWIKRERIVPALSRLLNIEELPTKDRRATALFSLYLRLGLLLYGIVKLINV